MAIDPIMLDPVLSTFRGMAQEIKEKGFVGEDVDKMNAALSRMEDLGNSLSDFNEFNGMVMQENLYGKFSDHYGKALTLEANQAQQEKGFDDSVLLKQTLDALRDAVGRLKNARQQVIDQANEYSSEEATRKGLEFLERNQEQYGINTTSLLYKEKKREAIQDAVQVDRDEQLDRQELIQKEVEVLFDQEALIKPIEDLIKIGEEEGMTLPRFLTIQIEKGLDKAMEGSAVLRSGLEYELKMAEAAKLNPYDILQKQKQITEFDELASVSKFNIPNSLDVTLAHNKIEWELEPKKIYWDELKSRMFKIISRIESILIANTNVFPSYDPYLMMATHDQKVKHAKYVKNCLPGIMKEEEKLIHKYYELNFLDFFNHEIFIWEVENYHIEYSQEYLEFLIRQVYPEIEPCKLLSKEVTATFESQFHVRNRIMNPEMYKAWERKEAALDEYFGEGYTRQKFGVPSYPSCEASPWNLNTFG